MQLVPIPTPTKARTIIVNGHPPSLRGGPARYVNAASRYPTPKNSPATRDSGLGLYRSQRYPNSGTGRYIANSAVVLTALTWNWLYLKCFRNNGPYNEYAVMLPAHKQLRIALAKLAYLSTWRLIFLRSRSMTPSTILLKKDSSSRRRRPAGREDWRESWEVGGRRWESKSSLSMCGLEGRLELREGIIDSAHCDCEQEGGLWRWRSFLFSFPSLSDASLPDRLTCRDYMYSVP